jgi:hypothetical protein
MVTNSDHPTTQASAVSPNGNYEAAAPEPFVDADAVAQFLSMTRRQVLRLTRQGRITGYACSGIKRLTYKYRLSVVAQDIANLKKPVRGMIAAGSPRSSNAKEKIHG